jgi:hypothetical protein
MVTVMLCLCSLSLQVTFSMLEIYNEQVPDPIFCSLSLSLVWDGSRALHVLSTWFALSYRPEIVSFAVAVAFQSQSPGWPRAHDPLPLRLNAGVTDMEAATTPGFREMMRSDTQN